MRNFVRSDTCIYNLLYVKFNENVGRENSFSYNLQYPSFYNFKNAYFHVDPNILNDINSLIKSDVYNFKNGLLEEEQEANSAAIKNALPQRNYKAIINYAVTFSKNHVLSTILNIMGFAGDYGPEYILLYNYNYDLLTGKNIFIKDVFNQGVDYIKVITDYVNYKISQNKSWYYPDVFIDISEDQAFYLTDEGLVIYFELEEIGPKELGIPKFTLSFEKFAPYINPRFYCSPSNTYRKSLRSR